MEIKKLPHINPSETIVWFDFEGVLCEKNILYYLFSYKPALALTSIFRGFVKAFCKKIQNHEKSFIEELIKECKSSYERDMDEKNLFNFGKFIFKNQSEKHKMDLIDLFYDSKEKYHDMYIITGANKKIVKGFLSCFPADINLKGENIYASEFKFINNEEKAQIVKYIKKNTNKKIIGIGDSKQDEKALEESDVRCVISSLAYKLMPTNAGNYKFKDLNSVKRFLSLINLAYEFYTLELINT